jgi:hypothetical protein
VGEYTTCPWQAESDQARSIGWLTVDERLPTEAEGNPRECGIGTAQLRDRVKSIARRPGAQLRDSVPECSTAARSYSHIKLGSPKVGLIHRPDAADGYLRVPEPCHSFAPRL